MPVISSTAPRRAAAVFAVSMAMLFTAACGSDETFESLLRGALDKSRRDFEAEYGDRFKPAFDSSAGRFDARSLQFQPYDPSAFQFSPGR